MVDARQASRDTIVIDPDIAASLSGGSLDEDQKVVIGNAEERIHAGLDISGALLHIITVDLSGVVGELYEELELLFGETFACLIVKLQTAHGQRVSMVIAGLVASDDVKKKGYKDVWLFQHCVEQIIILTILPASNNIPFSK